MIRAYWFGDNTLPNGDGRPVAIGTTHTVEPDRVEPCVYGLHASEHPFDALQYAHCATLWQVELGGVIKAHGDPVDKLACSERTYLARIDAEPVLRAFARWCALRVAHLWDMPVEVRRYLETGDEAFRAGAEHLASAAASAAARAAARAAAMAAASAAARDASAAAMAAARAAAMAAAMAAARDEQRAEFQRLIDEALAVEGKERGE